jgi:hypothetical protein
MSVDQPTGKHPFDQARETWEAWSMANTLRAALRHAREHGDHQALADFAQHPEWTQGPGPLEALRANRELVELLTGWRWQAICDARERGHAWAEVAAALGTTPQQARGDYLDAVERQRRAAQYASTRDPALARLLRFEPGWAQLAEPNAADLSGQQRQVTEREVRRER